MTRRNQAELLFLLGIILLVVFTCVVLAEISAGAPLNVAWGGAGAVISWQQSGEGSAVVYKCAAACALVAWELNAKAGWHVAHDPDPWPGAAYAVSLHGDDKAKLGPVTLPWRVLLVGVFR